MVDFKGSQFPKDVILYAVWFYVRFPVSYRDLEEIMAERGVELDHAILALPQNPNFFMSYEAEIV